MNEPICMVKIQLNNQKIIDDYEYDVDELTEHIINYFGTAEGTTAELSDDSIIVTLYDEEQFGRFFKRIETLYKKEWFKKYVKQYLYYSCDEMSTEGDRYILDDILEPFVRYGV